LICEELVLVFCQIDTDNGAAQVTVCCQSSCGTWSFSASSVSMKGTHSSTPHNLEDQREEEGKVLAIHSTHWSQCKLLFYDPYWLHRSGLL